MFSITMMKSFSFIILVMVMPNSKNPLVFGPFKPMILIKREARNTKKECFPL